MVVVVEKLKDVESGSAVEYAQIRDTDQQRYLRKDLHKSRRSLIAPK